jgi:hypothetical protein
MIQLFHLARTSFVQTSRAWVYGPLGPGRRRSPVTEFICTILLRLKAQGYTSDEPISHQHSTSTINAVHQFQPRRPQRLDDYLDKLKQADLLHEEFLTRRSNNRVDDAE